MAAEDSGQAPSEADLELQAALGLDAENEVANDVIERVFEDEQVKQDCLKRVKALCDRFPLYPHLNIPVPVLT